METVTPQSRNYWYEGPLRNRKSTRVPLGMETWSNKRDKILFIGVLCGTNSWIWCQLRMKKILEINLLCYDSDITLAKLRILEEKHLICVLLTIMIVCFLKSKVSNTNTHLGQGPAKCNQWALVDYIKYIWEVNDLNYSHVGF